jgi:hypothetical protein
MAHSVIGELNAAKQGQMKLTNFSTLQKPHYEDKVVHVSKNVAPLLVLIEKLRNSKTIAGPSYVVLKTDYHPTRVTLNGDCATGVTTMNVTAGHGARVKVGDILQNPRTGTEVRVTARATDALTITRPAGATTDADFVDTEELTILGNAQAEFSTAPESIMTDLGSDTNYMQTFRCSLEASRRLINTEYYGGSHVERNKKQVAEALRLMQEKTFLFGRSILATDPTMTAGLMYWLSTNVFAVGGALTEDYLNQTILPQVFMKNEQAPNFAVFIGEKARIAFQGFGLDAVRYTPETKMLGLNVGYYQSSFGTIKLLKHGIMSSIGSAVTAANTGYQGFMQMVNLDYVGKRIMKGGGMKFGELMMTNGPDGKKWGGLEDCGFFLSNEPAHGTASGITG